MRYVRKQQMRRVQNKLSLSFLYYTKIHSEIIINFMQDCKLQNQADWNQDSNQQYAFLTRTTMITLSSEFKFIINCTINKSIKLLTIEGRLVFNNGTTVFINPGHQAFIDRHLNHAYDSNKKRVIFDIDQSAETLAFAAKMNNIMDQVTADRFVKMCCEEVSTRKKNILCVIAIVGVPLDAENALMRRILIEKKKLKNQLEEILKRGTGKGITAMELQEEKSAQEEGGVFYFGGDTDLVLEQKMEIEDEKVKKLEGGYFSIEPSHHVIRNKKTGQIMAKRLVVKTLKEKRRNQDLNQQGNNYIKIKKELETINSLANKRFVIRYFCDISEINNISKVYMDHYDHSLQEYVHYLGNSLEFQQKIAISKQIVDAVIALHQSNVVHRDIKPANFLIDDSRENSDYMVKIIDFAESYKEGLVFQTDYACSNPYSPFQCNERKGFTENGPMQGIDRKEIDYWSVGITIYEVFFRKLPVSFSRAFLKDIASTWKTQLLFSVNQREKIGFTLVEDIISIICIKMMKFQQEQRMNLISTKRILEALQNYIKNLLQILEDNL